MGPKRPGEKGYKSIAATEEVISFCGWDYLLRLLSVCTSLFERGFLAGIFETGGRVSEVLQLTRSHFDFETRPDVVIVRNMPVLKRWTKDKGTGKVTKLRDYRTFPIKMDEPLASYLRDWSAKAPTDRPFGVSRNKAFLVIRGIGERLGEDPIPNTLRKDKTRPLYSSELAPHVLRAERACQLVDDYGFDVILLNSFFGWKPKVRSMAEKYAGAGWIGLARAMGVNA